MRRIWWAGDRLVVLTADGHPVTLRAAGTPQSPPVAVSGSVVAVHGRGVVVVGSGPVPATLTFTRVLPDARYRITTTPDGVWSTTLPPGSYAVTVTIADGTCPGAELEVVSGRPATVSTTCQDGVSTY